MNNWLIVRYYLGLCFCVLPIFCETWAEAKAEYVKLYDAYSINSDAYTDTIPTNDFTQPLEVTLQLEMNSLAGYDAVNGALEIIGSLSMTWTDDIDNLNSVGFSSNTVGEAVVDYRKIWTPVIVLINSANSIQRVGDETYKVRFNLDTGQVTWKPRMIIKSSCSPDVSYFPFDQQKCTFTFAPWYLEKTSLKLSVSSYRWNLDQYDPNGVWEIESTESAAFTSGNYYYATFTVTFNREPTYFTVNLVLPILLLSILSGVVFLLPAASGERVGFGITCFLSFVVLLQTMMTYLPEASAPMSLLCYYVIVMMMFSACLSIITILLLRVYHKPKGEEVPRWLVHFMEIIKCVKCRRIKCCNKSNAIKDSSKDIEKGKLLKVVKPMPSRLAFGSAILLDTNTSKTNGNSLKLSNHDIEKVMETGKNHPSKRTDAKNHGNKKLSIASITTGKLCDTKKSQITPRRNGRNVHVIAPGLEVVTNSSSNSSSSSTSGLDEIDWDTVGRLLDTFFLLVFLGVQCAFSFLFLVPIALRV